MPRSSRIFCSIALLAVASCASNSSTRSSIPGGNGQYPDGGPPWTLPPGPQSEVETASLPPDIATPFEGLAGSWNGGRLGYKLNKQTRAKMIDLTQSALAQGQSGKMIKWSDGPIRGTIVPQISFAGPGSTDCREFHQTLRFKDVVETGYATACRASNGEWRILAE